MTMDSIPMEMNAAVLESFSGPDALRIERRPVPKPGPNEVLIKVAASPINPSDLVFLEGLYGIKKSAPVIPGLEGSGTVVAAGSGLMGKFLVGKKVACASQENGDGVWAEYMVTSVNYALPLHKSVSLEQGSMSIVNPMTAIALLGIAKKLKQRSVLITAGASALGQMINRLFKHEGIDVINIVRREEQVSLLKQQGVEWVLNSSDEDFQQQLHDTCQRYKVRLSLDALGGSSTNQILEAMLPDSKIYVYGGMSYELLAADPAQLIFQNKSIEGFWMAKWITENSLLQNMSHWRKGQRLMNTDLASIVRRTYKLSEVRDAVKDYQNHMTGGKVLITM